MITPPYPPFTVTNRTTGEVVNYHGPSPEESVRLAYLQITCRDWKPWHPAKKSPPVEHDGNTVRCGDWETTIPQAQAQAEVGVNMRQAALDLDRPA